jgi:hypothetical protein
MDNAQTANNFINIPSSQTSKQEYSLILNDRNGNVKSTQLCKFYTLKNTGVVGFCWASLLGRKAESEVEGSGLGPFT